MCTSTSIVCVNAPVEENKTRNKNWSVTYYCTICTSVRTYAHCPENGKGEKEKVSPRPEKTILVIFFWKTKTMDGRAGLTFLSVMISIYLSFIISKCSSLITHLLASPLPRRTILSTFQSTKVWKMQNAEGQNVDLYIPVGFIVMGFDLIMAIEKSWKIMKYELSGLHIILQCVWEDSHLRELCIRNIQKYLIHRETFHFIASQLRYYRHHVMRESMNFYPEQSTTNIIFLRNMSN